MSAEQSKACRTSGPGCRSAAPAFAIVCLLVLAALLLTGCIPGDPVKGIFDNAISRLEQQSADWQKIARDTKADLIKAGQSTLANEVEKVLGAAIGDAEAAGFCAVDYFRNRLKEDLIRIRATYTGEKVTLTPYFCSANPPQIDMSLAPDRRSSIIIYGYNLNSTNVRVILIDNNNQQTDVTANSAGVSNLADSSAYKLALNLGGNGVVLNGTSKLLRFDLAGNDTRSINVIQPIIPIGVQVDAHVQGIGWMGWKDNPSTDDNFAGSQQKNAQIEAVRIRLLNAPPGMKICYQAEGQGYRWTTPEVCDGVPVGTTGQGRRLEALVIRLVDAPAGAHVQYRASIPSNTPAGQWLGWQTDGTMAGTEGQGIPVVAINVKITGP